VLSAVSLFFCFSAFFVSWVGLILCLCSVRVFFSALVLLVPLVAFLVCFVFFGSLGVFFVVFVLTFRCRSALRRFLSSLRWVGLGPFSFLFSARDSSFAGWRFWWGGPGW